jgi:hypothetical protein
VCSLLPDRRPQVLCNALAGRLWSRTTIYLHRALARLVGVTEAELRGAARISFAKVAEYQKRGAVHFHAIIRLDAATDGGCPACMAPPPAGFTADLLERAVRQAATTVSVPCPAVDDDQAVTLVARWGEQLVPRQDPRRRRTPRIAISAPSGKSCHTGSPPCSLTTSLRQLSPSRYAHHRGT